MKNQKNGFFTLVFSLCPGAGEMYMGLYQQGISLMGAFFLLGALTAWTGMEVLLFLEPVIWCYSFFHTHNLRAMSVEEFAEVEDHFFWVNYVETEPGWKLTDKHRKLCAGILILMAISFLWREGLDFLGRFFSVPGILWRVSYLVPQLAIGLVILYLGIHLWNGKRTEKTEESTEEDAA